MEPKTNPPAATQPPSFPRQVHLSDYFAVIRRRKWVVILVFLAVVGITTAATLLSKAIYKATTQIVIERDASPLDDIGQVAVQNARETDYYPTQYRLLGSRTLAYKVIEDLGLARRFAKSEVKVTTPLSLISKVVRAVRAKLGLDGPEDSSEATRSKVEPSIVDWYLSNLEITPVRGTRLVNVSFLGGSPEMVARIADAHTRAFIHRNVHMQQSAAQQALDWLKTQLQEQKAKVEASQRRIHKYMKANKITEFEGPQSIPSEELIGLNASLIKAKADRMIKRAVYNQLNGLSTKKENLLSLPEFSQDSVLLGLHNQLIELKAKRLSMSTRYGPKHPKMRKMRELDFDIQQLKKDMLAEVKRLKASSKAELDRAVAIEKSIQKALDGQKRKVTSLREKAIDYDVLQQQAESNQHIYDILLKETKEIGLTKLIESSNVRVVDRAEVPRFPVRPRVFLNILLAVVLGLIMGTGLAFFREYMDDTLKAPGDVSQRLRMPVLGVIPYDKSIKKGKTAALLAETSRAGEMAPNRYPHYDLTGGLPAVLQLTDQATLSGQVLVLASATMGEGKTTVLAQLSGYLANSGLRVLMVDCDLQRPALHQILGIKNGQGLVIPMSRIMSHKIRAGTLREYSLDDLFFLIRLRKNSGVLFVKNDYQAMKATFQNGQLLHIENRDNPRANRLGSMLLRGGFVTADQLEEALERNQRTGQPLGYILLNAAYIKQDQLRGPLKLQMEEHLQRLFSWRHGSFSFRPEKVEIHEHERIHFGEDYTPLIRRLGHLTGSRFLENEILSQVKSLREKNVYVLTTGSAPSNWGGQFNLTLMSKFLDILRRRFDVILLDGPPVLNVAGSAPLSALADSVIFVIKAGHQPVIALNQAKSSLDEAKAKILGAVLNQVKVRQDYYYR